jgi:molybdenum cofactor synthesis domain-containing protein
MKISYKNYNKMIFYKKEKILIPVLFDIAGLFLYFDEKSSGYDMGKVKSISISEKKGTKKHNVDSVRVIDDFGLENDAHAGFMHRQVSFLAVESIEKMRKQGLNVKSGDFAENITTEGIELCSFKPGDILKINNIEFIISQMGKVCHHRCAIYFQAGDCIMPKEGVFAVVKGNGEIKSGDKIEYIPKNKMNAAVITLSDKGSKGEREDITGVRIIDFLKENLDLSFVRYDMIPDEKNQLESLLKELTDRQEIDIIVTNGSTGIAPRDIAPDVTGEIVEKRLPGFEEAMRMESFKVTPHALISRAVCGTRNRSFILNVPGSPKGAIENLTVVLKAIPHTVKKLQGDQTDCAVH